MRKKYYVSELMDSCLKMNLSKIYIWRDWYKSILKLNIPVKTDNGESIAEIKWKRERLYIKDKINREFINRNKSNRLYVRCKQGVYMKEDRRASDEQVLRRGRKIGSCIATTIISLEDFLLSLKNGKDKKMIERIIMRFEDEKVHIGNGFGRMLSIPKEVREKLRMELLK